MDVDVRRLMLLREVARCGSLTVTAKEMSLTTSAVSQQISKLEREVGVPLIDRHPRGVRLTDAGRSLVVYADRVDRLMSAAEAEMAEYAGAHRGQLRIGAFPTVGASLMPLFVTQYRAQHPRIALTVRSARFDQLVEWLHRRELDLTLLWDYPWDQLDDPEITLTPLMRDPMLLLLPDGHRLAGSVGVDLADLRDDQWVTRAEHPVGSVLSRICSNAGYQPRIAFAANDYQEAQGMVAAGIGICLAPKLATMTLRPDVHAVPITGDPAPRRIFLAQLRERRRSPAMNAAAAVLRGCARELAQARPDVAHP